MKDDKVVSTEAFDVVIEVDSSRRESREFIVGLREVRKRLPGATAWHEVESLEEFAVSDYLQISNAPRLVVILDSALIVSDNLGSELLDLLSPDAQCVLPNDPRGVPAGTTLDYATRPGFDRFVARLSSQPRLCEYDGRAPWLYSVARQTLVKLNNKTKCELKWSEVPSVLAGKTAISQHAFVHSYTDYYSNSRTEMLSLIPPEVRSLLDVGGGEGGFALGFLAERGGAATVLEMNPRAGAVARSRGLEVIPGEFESVHISRKFDCITFLDVLEHLVDPYQALVKARQHLSPGACLLLSVPNVGHWSVVCDLLEGDFEYQPVGILCNTHLRFFTRTSLEKLLQDTGFCIEKWNTKFSPCPESFIAFAETCAPSWLNPDLESLGAESFHVLARPAVPSD